jgi:hypothetical protein
VTTITIEILDDNAYALLKDMERSNLIHIKSIFETPQTGNLAAKYKGKMAKQSIEEIDKQCNDLRDEWDRFPTDK